MNKRLLIAAGVIAALAALYLVIAGKKSAEKSASQRASAGEHAAGVKGLASSAQEPAHASVHGRVLDDEDQAIAHASVLLTPNGDNPPELAADDAMASSTAAGEFKVEALAAGSYRLSASAPGFLPSQSQIDLRPGQALQDVQVRLVRGGHTLQGVVRDLTGGTIAGAQVQLTAITGIGRSDGTRAGTQSEDSGHYQIQLASGRYLARAYHPDYVPTTSIVEIGEGDQELDLALAPGAQVDGIVRRVSDDAPVPFARVMYQSDTGANMLADRGSAAWVIADAEGRFHISGLPSGALSLRARAEHAVSAEPTRIALGIADHNSEVVLYLSTALRVRGTVVDAKSKKPVAGMRVSASGDNGAVAAREESADDGSFVIEGLAAGSYRISAEGEHYVPRLFAGSVAVHQDLDTLVVEVDKGVMVEGRVEPAQVASVSVDMQAMEGFSINAMQGTQSAEDGSFSLGPFLPGTIRLQAESAQGTQGTTQVEVAGADLNGADLNGVVITLEEQASISGRVVDAKGLPQADVKVVLRKAANRNMSIVVNGQDMLAKSAHTSPDGSYVVRGLSEGSYKMQVEDAQGEVLRFAGQGVKSSAVDEADRSKDLVFNKQEHKENVLLSVESRDASIEGVVIGPDGKPAADVWVVASASGPEGLLGGLLPEGLVDAHGAPQDQGRGNLDGNQDGNLDGNQAHSESHVEVRMVISEDAGGQGEGEGGVDFGGAKERPPVLTNERGQFVIRGLRAGLYDLRADGMKGSARAFLRQHKTGESARLKLETLTRIEGLVKMGSDPVSDFVVELKGGTPRRKQVHDADGAFYLHRIDPGRYTIVARNDQGQAEADIEVLPGKATEVLLQMEVLSRVSGRIVDAQGAPMAGVLVIAAPMQGDNMAMSIDDDTQPTGADGHFEIGVKPGNYMLVALQGGAAPFANRPFTVAADQKLVELGDVGPSGGGFGGAAPDLGEPSEGPTEAP